MPSQEEHDQLLKENERLKLENHRLLLIARKLQEEKNAFQKVADTFDKRMDQVATIQKEMQEKFICKFEILKIGVKEILQDASEKRAELVHRLKDWLNTQQPSLFLKGASLDVEKNEEELVNAINSLFVTLEKTGEKTGEDSSSVTVTSEETEKFINSLDADHEDSQKFAGNLKDKIAPTSSSVPSDKSITDNHAADQDAIFIKWEPLEEEKTEQGSSEEPEVITGSLSAPSKDQFILVRVPDGRGEKAGWKYAVAKLLRQAKMSKKGGGSIGKIFKVDYYKRQVSWDSFQPFKLYENKKGFVIDEGDIVLKLPAPFNSSGQRLVRFDFNFKDYNVPY